MSKKRQSKKQQIPPGFQIPQACLLQLGEFTNGYLLFSYNEFGIPQVYSHCDNPMMINALQNHVKKWVSALDEIDKQMTIQQIVTS